MAIYEWDEDIQALVLQTNSLEHRSKWACFSSRKSFVRKRQTDEQRVVCPDCSEESTDMGHLFEPPPKRDQRSWEVMEVLARFGLRFSRPGTAFFIDRILTEQGGISPKNLLAKLEGMVARAKPGSQIGLTRRR